MERKCGIYKITNRQNNKSYVGQSVDILSRWRSYGWKLQDNSPSHKQPIYRAIQKYGKGSFDFEVLEECSPDLLNEREEFWISELNTFNEGYNATKGGGQTFTPSGEDHYQARISNQALLLIREAYGQGKSCLKTYEELSPVLEGISLSGFKQLFYGYKRRDVAMEVYQIQRPNMRAGTNNGKAKLTENQVREIRSRRDAGESKNNVFKDFSHLVKIGAFTNCWTNATYKGVV